MTTTASLTKSTSFNSAGQPVHFIPAKNHRFLFLDALRGIAAVFVVFFHLPNATTAVIATNGMMAVDFFFCLSGFVIAFSYEKRLADSLSLKDFAVARLIRLYPIYILGAIVGLICTAVVQHIAFGAIDGCLHWVGLFALALFLWPTRLSPVHAAVNFPLNIPSWSLFYELAANFAYAFLVKLRLAGTAVIGGIAAMSIAILGSSLLHGGTVDVGNKAETLGMGFARVAFSFCAGILIFRIYRSTSHKTAGFASHWAIAALVTLSIVLILMAPATSMRSSVFRLLAIVVCFPTLVYCGAIVALPHFFSRVSAVLGELSYPLYLLHAPFLLPLFSRRVQRFFAEHAALGAGSAVLLVAILTFAFWWLGKHFDVPVRRLLVNLYNPSKDKVLVTT